MSLGTLYITNERSVIQRSQQLHQTAHRLPGRPGGGEELNHRSLHYQPLRGRAQRTPVDMQPTVGIDFNVRDISRNGQVYRLQMWDTAGQERYRSLIPTYLKNAHCVVFVYDVTLPSSLDNTKNWHKMFTEHQQAPGFLLGNKIDLNNARYSTTHSEK